MVQWVVVAWGAVWVACMPCGFIVEGIKLRLLASSVFPCSCHHVFPFSGARLFFNSMEVVWLEFCSLYDVYGLTEKSIYLEMHVPTSRIFFPLQAAIFCFSRVANVKEDATVIPVMDCTTRVFIGAELEDGYVLKCPLLCFVMVGCGDAVRVRFLWRSIGC